MFCVQNLQGWGNRSGFNDLNEAGGRLNEAYCAVLTKLAELFRKLFINRLGIKAERFADPEEFHHIQSPLPMFNPPDKGIFPMKFFRKSPLRKTGSLTHIDELLKHDLIFIRVDGFLHLTA